jgi:hypothetical protein
MIPRTALATVAAVLLVAPLAGCALREPGPKTTQTREIGPASGVALAMAGSVEVSVGAEPSLTVTGGENLLADLRTEVEGDVLVIDLEGPGGWLGGEVAVDVVLPALASIDISGSGTVDVGPLEGDDLRIEVGGSGSVAAPDLDVDAVSASIGGSGDIVLGGSARSQDVSIGGSGTYSAQALESEEASVSIGGSGRADVTVTRFLDVRIGGSGTVTYAGNPTLTSQVTGSGSVSER